MKASKILHLVAAASLLVSCSKTAPESKPAPGATPTPTPASASIPTPVTPHLAPPGVFFAIQRFSVTTSDGIHGFPPGTKFTLIKDLGDRLRVMTGGFQFEVAPSDLTNDMDFAAAASLQNAQSQKALATYLQQSNTVTDPSPAIVEEPASPPKVPATNKWLQARLEERPTALENGAYNHEHAPYYYDSEYSYPRYRSYPYYRRYNYYTYINETYVAPRQVVTTPAPARVRKYVPVQAPTPPQPQATPFPPIGNVAPDQPSRGVYPDREARARSYYYKPQVN